MTRRHLRRLIVLVIVLILVAVAAPAQEYLAVSIDARVLATDREAATGAIAEWAQSVGGYFTLRTDGQVIIRVPNDRVGEFRPFLEGLGVTVLSYNPQTQDVREDLYRVEAGITSRSESIDQILQFLDNATITATLSFERELRDLLDELERYLGRRRRIMSDTSYALIETYLTSRQQTVPQQQESSFAWINTIDLYRFLARVEQ